MSLKILGRLITKSRRVWLPLLFLLTLLMSAATTNSNERVQPLKVTALKAMLFYEDNGTFSPDVAAVDSGPPYVPPSHWNTPVQYENRSSSVLVIVEITGDAELTPERKLEFTATYVPWQRESRPLVIRKVVPINIPVKVGEPDKFNAGFWLYETGCNPVKLTARIVGQRPASMTKRVIRFGCGE
jgi:hypothetical protein